MDSLTHIAIGSCIGEAFFGKTIGKKAMIWGALAQSVPDVDFVAAFWLDNTSNLLAHRGFTHSILFGLLVAVFLALIAEKWHRPHDIAFRKWMLFFTARSSVGTTRKNDSCFIIFCNVPMQINW